MSSSLSTEPVCWLPPDTTGSVPSPLSGDPVAWPPTGALPISTRELVAWLLVCGRQGQ